MAGCSRAAVGAARSQRSDSQAPGLRADSGTSVENNRTGRGCHSGTQSRVWRSPTATTPPTVVYLCGV
jgi:hypothetical protein